MPPRALLFDFDGVIADTENIHVAAWERTFGDMGLDVPPEVCACAAEVDDRAFLAGVFRTRNIEGGDVEGWLRRKQDLTVRMLVDSPRIYPGVPALIGRLSEVARLAIVSTTWRANISAVLAPSGLLDDFAEIIGKEDVTAVKPDPAAYRLALRRLKVKAAESLALEDSPTGLTAARAAKIPCLAVGHRRDAGPWCDGASSCRTSLIRMWFSPFWDIDRKGRSPTCASWTPGLAWEFRGGRRDRVEIGCAKKCAGRLLQNMRSRR